MSPNKFKMHCYGHSLDLAASDTMQKCKVMNSALETTFEITKLVKYSPQREQLFKAIMDEIAPGYPGVRVLSHTMDSSSRLNDEHHKKTTEF